MAATDAIQKLPVSPRLQTPPSSPELPPYKQTLSSDHVQLFVDLLKAAQSIQTVPAATEANQPAGTGETSEDKNIFKSHSIRYVFQLMDKTTVDADLADLRRGTRHNGGEA